MRNHEFKKAHEEWRKKYTEIYNTLPVEPQRPTFKANDGRTVAYIGDDESVLFPGMSGRLVLTSDELLKLGEWLTYTFYYG